MIKSLFAIPMEIYVLWAVCLYLWVKPNNRLNAELQCYIEWLGKVCLAVLLLPLVSRDRSGDFSFLTGIAEGILLASILWGLHLLLQTLNSLAIQIWPSVFRPTSKEL